MKRIAITALFLFCFFPLYAFALDIIKPPELKISGYTQIRYIRDNSDASSTSNDYKYKDQFEVMKARLTFKATIDPMASLNVQIDPAIKDVKDNLINILTDAYFDLGYLKGHNIRLGQFKLPFGLENPIADSRTFPVNASLIKGKTINTRDIGIDISAKKDWYEYHVGVINGNGSNKQDDNSRKDVIVSSRFTRGSVSFGGSAVSSGGIIATEKMRHAANGFIQYTPKWGEIDFEYMRSRFLNSTSLKTTFREGWYIMAVPQLNERTWLTLRYEKYDPNTGTVANPDDEITRTTAGLLYTTSKYSRIKINYEWKNDEKVAFEGNVFTFMWQVEY